MIRVLLVDGVGNAVTYEDETPWPPTRICVGPHQFLRTDEDKFDDMPIYRLRGFIDGPPVPIRHVSKLAKETL